MTRKTSENKPAAGQSLPRIWEAALLLGMLICMFYLLGRVQMNKMQREKSKLEKEKVQLVAYRQNLEIEIKQLKSPGYIAEKVAARGLGHISAAMTDELVVGFDEGVGKESGTGERRPINYAGIRLPVQQ
ncbi:hypothetical protein JXO52_12025 [bacterium]|nr:hypothetical protein [bacterium]